jgi:serine/threonine protein kinase/WD40 repeat protein
MSQPRVSERSIFEAAIEKATPAERAAFLDQACGTDPDLRRDVEALLAAHERLGGHALTADTLACSTTGPADTAIGPYQLLERIGEGGFGVVFLAEQRAPIWRNVALKVLKPGMDSRQVIARFEAERQALALMDHPNIAKVHDGGTTADGRPYFVMELVSGVPITDDCDHARRTPRERLALFIEVCAAVQHAHQKGIIHRDLKPSNVLVTMQDGRPLAKVIDFGIAKALGRELTDRTLCTGHGQLIGTPLYMAPEQAALSSADVDTRSDVYSLGVLLYELFTGTTPFAPERLRQVGYDEMRRILREEEPPRPSVRIAGLGPAAGAIAAQRRSDPRRLGQLCRGELDWIVMKCLAKEPPRRYETVSALARDVERHLRDEPVEARPPSAAYRWRKFASRHKLTLSLVAAAVLSAALAIGLLAASTIIIAGEQKITQDALTAETNAKQELQESLLRERHLTGELRVALAHRHWLIGDGEEAKRQLEECPPEQRGPAWRALHRLCYGELLRLECRTGWVSQVRYSWDGRLLATLSNLGQINAQGKPNARTTRVEVWDAHTGQRRFVVVGPHVDIHDFAFTADGKGLITVGAQSLYGYQQDRTPRAEVTHWELATGEVVGGLDLPNTLIRTGYRPFVLSGDGRRLIGRLWPSGRMVVWDTDDGAEVTSIDLPEDFKDFREIVLTPDGSTLATDEPIKLGHTGIWDTRTGRLLHQVATGRIPLLDLPASSAIYSLNSLAISADGTRIAVTRVGNAGADGEVKVFDVRSGAVLATIRPHANLVGRPAFSPDGRRLAWAEAENLVAVWDLDQGEELFSFRGHSKPITHLEFRPDGQRLASAGSDGTVRVWDVSPLEAAPAPQGGGKK